MSIERDLFGLDGKVAVVTGASSGLGKTFAETMANAGASVVCTARREDKLKEVVAGIERNGGNALAVITDVTSDEDIKQMVATVVDKYGKVDILWNNAGIQEPAFSLLHEYPMEAYDTIMAVDVKATVVCAREVLKVMVKQKSGKIINVSSIWGLNSSGKGSIALSYCTAKGAVVNFTRELANNYASFGITVNCLAPGVFDTEISNVKDEKGRLVKDEEGNPKQLFTDEIINAMEEAHVPMARMGGASSDELKGACLFLSAKASDYMTGQILAVDGGYSLW